MRRKLDQLHQILLMVLVMVMVVSALLQIFARMIDWNVQFTEELTIYAMMWVTLFGSSYAFGLKKHVAIDLISPGLNEVNRKRLLTIIEMIILLFAFIILIVGGSRFVWITFKLGQVSSVMHLPKGWVYLALPISGLMIVWYGVLNILNPQKKTV